MTVRTSIIYWTCVTCDLVGELDKTAEQHTRQADHVTMTGTNPATLARMREALASDHAAQLAACREVAAKRAGR